MPPSRSLSSPELGATFATFQDPVEVKVAANFWKLDHPPERLAVVDVHSGRERTYGELRADVGREVREMAKPSRKSLVLLLAQNRYESLVAYLAALNSGDALMLVDATLNRELLLQLIETYRPDRICGSAASAENPFPGYSKRDA
jgi:acyl-CoA synthetase (AMP-forming)/AMP-acid ligase II